MFLRTGNEWVRLVRMMIWSYGYNWEEELEGPIAEESG